MGEDEIQRNNQENSRNGCEATARQAILEFLMKNLCLFLSMDAGLVSDTRLIYPLKIAESQRLKGGKVDPEIPEFEKAPSRSLMIMARLGVWNECLGKR